MRNLKSSNEALVLRLIHELLPNIRIKEQYGVRYRGHVLYFDFFVPALRVLIEVDGRQHDEFNSFFHSSLSGYYEQYYRDRLKEEWAFREGYILLRIKEDELKNMTSEELWRRLLDAKKQGEYDGSGSV